MVVGIRVEVTRLVSLFCVVGKNGDVALASLLTISVNPDGKVLLNFFTLVITLSRSIVCSSSVLSTRQHPFIFRYRQRVSEKTYTMSTCS